jgi:hypothetical protein
MKPKLKNTINLIQDCIEEYEKSHGVSPRQVSISWFEFDLMQQKHFVKEWHNTMKNSDVGIISEIGMVNLLVDKNQKESIIVG